VNKKCLVGITGYIKMPVDSGCLDLQI